MNLKNILGEKQDQKVRTKELRSRIQGANWSPTEALWTTKPPLPIGAQIPQKHLSAQSQQERIYITAPPGFDLYDLLWSSKWTL